MLKLVVCIKQVPMVSELPWNPKTGSLRRELAEGMMNPACRFALEEALMLKHEHGAEITAITMGPPMAEEVLHQAVAMKADKGILLTDRRMAGGDTLVTSKVLATAIKKECPDFDLILCGSCTTDSETAQVGPQLAEEFDIPGVSCVEEITLSKRALVINRYSDDFFETMEMDLPGLVTVSPKNRPPRYLPMAGVQEAFDQNRITVLNSDYLGIGVSGIKASPTKIMDVYSPTANKDNVVLKGTARKVVDRLFLEFGDRISGAMGKDLKTHDHEEES